MACSNRLLNLPLELFFKITNHLTIFDLNNMEKSGLFELNEQGISDVIQAAFERPRHINIHIDDVKDYVDIIPTTELVLRCGTGLRSLIVKMRNQASFLIYHHENDEEFAKKLAVSCPNIERFARSDYFQYDTGHPLMDYIKNIEVSKLVEIYAADLTLDDFRILFTASLKSVIVNDYSQFIESMEELSMSRPNFGTNIEQLLIFPVSDVNSSSLKKLSTFFPNLETIKVKPIMTNGIECVYNREQINRPGFVYQLELISNAFLDGTLRQLPYINIDRGERFDLSSIIQCKPSRHRFDADVFDQLTNLRSLHLNGNKMMSHFSDYLGDTSFKSLKTIDFSLLELNAENVENLEKILFTRRFFIRSIIHSNAIGVHSALIPLLKKFCRNVKNVDIQLEATDKQTFTLSTVEMEFLKEVGIAYRSRNTFSINLSK